MRITSRIVAATAAALLSGTAVFAGGPVEPVDPVVVAPVAPVGIDWTGPYAGVILSYNQGDYGNGADFPGDGEGDLDGYGGGLVLGYNWQRGNWVYGGELTYSALNVEGAESCVVAAWECGVEIDKLATLRGRVGYAAGPKSLVYATAGFAAADGYAYTDGPGGEFGETKRMNGYVFGLGFEHALSQRVSMRGAVLRHNFDENDFQTDGPYSDIDMDFTTIEVGVVMRF